MPCLSAEVPQMRDEVRRSALSWAAPDASLARVPASRSLVRRAGAGVRLPLRLRSGLPHYCPFGLRPNPNELAIYELSMTNSLGGPQEARTPHLFHAMEALYQMS